jgi:hypothetical protein
MRPVAFLLLLLPPLAAVLAGALEAAEDERTDVDRRAEEVGPRESIPVDAPEAVAGAEVRRRGGLWEDDDVGRTVGIGWGWGVSAQFVLTELRQLSDSGVYETLELVRIVDAAVQTGIFHRNVFLTLELASPHLIGGAQTARHEVAVLTALDDPTDRSFAIDEFPIMDEEAIERFWVQKARKHRDMRNKVLDSLDAGLSLEEAIKHVQL